MSKLTRDQQKRIVKATIILVIVSPIILLVADTQAAIFLISACIAGIASSKHMMEKQNEKQPITEVDEDTDKIPYPDKTLEYYQYIQDNRAAMKGPNHYLGWLLRDVDLKHLSDTDFKVLHLSANNTYYISAEPYDTHAQDTLLALEAALNLTENYPATGLKTTGYKDFTMKLLFESFKIRYQVTGIMGKNIAYPDFAREDMPELDYYTRLALGTALEGVFTIYRFTDVFKLNWPEKTAYIRVHTTYPDSLRPLTVDPKQQAKLALDLSLRDVAQAAQLALGVANINKVCVELIDNDNIYDMNALKHDPYSVASATFTRKDKELLDSVILHNKAKAQDVFDIDYELDDNGHLIPRDAKYVFNKALQQTPNMYKPFSLKECNNAHFLDLFFAKSPADLEYSPDRIARFMFNEFLPSEDKTCEGVVKTLTKIKELTDDTYTIDACNRAITDLIKGDIEPDDEDALDEYLLWHHMNMEEHLSEIMYDVIEGDLSFKFYKENLDGYLNSIKHTNTNEVVYICTGNSITERIAYNRAHAQDTRRVELLPDEYANVLVHTITDYLNHDICDASEIKPYVDELLRIGNSACYNINLATKYYLKNSQPYTAIKLCKNALMYSPSKQDAAIYAYLAAYASWQAGDIKTATGLYLLAKDSNTDISKQATNELSDLISENPEYRTAKAADMYKYISKNGWATTLQESYKLTNQTPPTDDLTYDELMKTGIIYAVDEGMYDLGYEFIPEQLDKKTDLMASVARSLI